MSWFCQQCGSPNGDTTPTCMTCGAVAPMASPTAPQGYDQRSGYAPGQVYGQQPPPGAWGPPGAPPQWQGGPPMAAAAHKDDSNKKLIGCGIAGCFGLMLVGGLLVGILAYAGGSDGGSSRPSKSAPSGSLRDLIPNRVGKWRAVSAKPLQVEGAVDSLLVKFESGSQELAWAGAVFSSEAESSAALEGAANAVQKDVGTSPDRVNIRDPDGKLIGEGRHFKTSPEFICYKIGKLMAVVSGPRGDVPDFIAALP
ncbi:MAG: hypothetical protein R3B72_20310 [Polyangiaceae bacterium]